MEYVSAKTILSPYGEKNDWFGTNYNMNLYKGCSHGCIYCDSRSQCYGIEDFDRVRAKKDTLEIVQKELASKKKGGVIGMGGMGDPYNPLEKELNLTGRTLDLIDRYRFGVVLSTKSALITRDRERFAAIARHSPVLVQMTVTTADDDLCRIVEPRVSVSSVRFEALAEFSRAGLTTGILLMPLLPYLEDNRDNILSIITSAEEAGVRCIYPGFGVTLRDNQREWYYAELDRRFPGLSDRYRKAFGDRYGCSLPHAKELIALFRRECDRRGILYRMGDIIKAYQDRAPGRQLTLF